MFGKRIFIVLIDQRWILFYFFADLDFIRKFDFVLLPEFSRIWLYTCLSENPIIVAWFLILFSDLDLR